MRNQEKTGARVPNSAPKTDALWRTPLLLLLGTVGLAAALALAGILALTTIVAGRAAALALAGILARAGMLFDSGLLGGIAGGFLAVVRRAHAARGSRNQPRYGTAHQAGESR